MLKSMSLTLVLAYASTLALTVAVFDRSLTSDPVYKPVVNLHGTGCPPGTRWDQSDRICKKGKQGKQGK
jgi:hypothetical protein